MHWGFLAVGVLIVVFAFRMRQNAKQLTATLAQIPDIYEALKTTGEDGSFAVFMLANSDDDALNIQFSIENGSAGLDWVLISQTNIRDREKFEAILESQNVAFGEELQNRVSYVRTTDDRAPQLCQQVLQQLYDVHDDAVLELVVEAFDWRPDSTLQ